MNTITNTAMKIHILPQDHAYLVIYDDSTILKCSRCGRTRDTTGLYAPTFPSRSEIEYHAHAQHHSSRQWMASCTCYAPNPGGDTYKMLQEIKESLGRCGSVEDVRRLIMSLMTTQEAPR